jgi:hypothetical protein
MENIPASSTNSLPFYTPAVAKPLPSRHSSRLPLPRPRSVNYALHLNGNSAKIILIQSAIRKVITAKHYFLVHQTRSTSSVLIQSVFRRYHSRDCGAVSVKGGNTPRKMTYVSSLFMTPPKATRTLNTPVGDASPAVYLHGKRLFTPNPVFKTNDLGKLQGTTTTREASSSSISMQADRNDTSMSSPTRSRTSMGTPMRVPVLGNKFVDNTSKLAASKVQINPVQSSSQAKLDQVLQQPEGTHLTVQDLLNQVTQRNTTANSRYTRCIPKLINVERFGDPPESPCESFLFGKKSQWDGCSDGTCINTKDIVSGLEGPGLSEQGKIQFNRRVQVIGHDPSCKYARSTLCSGNLYHKQCLKLPSKKPSESNTTQVLDKETVCIQKIVYIGCSTKSSTKTTPMMDNRTRRVFGGSKPLRCKQ